MEWHWRVCVRLTSASVAEPVASTIDWSICVATMTGFGIVGYSWNDLFLV
jgi:hypothetical protein